MNAADEESEESFQYGRLHIFPSVEITASELYRDSSGWGWMRRLWNLPKPMTLATLKNVPTNSSSRFSCSLGWFTCHSSRVLCRTSVRSPCAPIWLPIRYIAWRVSVHYEPPHLLLCDKYPTSLSNLQPPFWLGIKFHVFLKPSYRQQVLWKEAIVGNWNHDFGARMRGSYSGARFAEIYWPPWLANHFSNNVHSSACTLFIWTYIQSQCRKWSG